MGVPGSMGDVSPVSPAQRTQTAATVEYVSPPSDVSEFVDAFHEGEEVRFRRIDNVIGEAEVPGLAARGLGSDALLLMSVEEPTTFAVAERDAAWRKAMLEEMEAIEQKCRMGPGTWSIRRQVVGRSGSSGSSK